MLEQSRPSAAELGALGDQRLKKAATKCECGDGSSHPVRVPAVYCNGEAAEQRIGVVLEDERGPMAKIARKGKDLNMWT